MTRWRTVLRGQDGYTLAELLVVAAVVAFILSGMLSLIMSGSQSWVIGSNRVEAQQSTRLVLARLAQDVRTAGWDPRATSSFPSIRALPPGRTGFVISNDWNANGTIETAAPVLVNLENRGEEITYEFLSGTTTLQRLEAPVDASPVAVTGAIASIQFRYLDADDGQVNNAHLTTEANKIRTVEITVTTTPDQGGSAANTVHVTSTSRARVRNRS